MIRASRIDSRVNLAPSLSGFGAGAGGNRHRMIGAALALVVLGVVLLFLFPWAGIVVGAAGVVLAVLFLVGFGRRAQTGRP